MLIAPCTRSRSVSHSLRLLALLLAFRCGSSLQSVSASSCALPPLSARAACTRCTPTRRRSSREVDIYAHRCDCQTQSCDCAASVSFARARRRSSIAVSSLLLHLRFSLPPIRMPLPFPLHIAFECILHERASPMQGRVDVHTYLHISSQRRPRIARSREWSEVHECHLNIVVYD
jgi:hypothetical protein